MALCMHCARTLTGDEIGLHRKIVNRGATQYLCLTCLAKEFACEESLLERKIEEFREQGCMLFAPKKQ